MDADEIPESQVTPPAVYFNRRTFMRSAVAVATVAATGAGYRFLNPPAAKAAKTAKIVTALTTAPADAGFVAAEAKTSLADVTTYNNFYEFTEDKRAVAATAAKFTTTGWQVAVGGMVRKPTVFGIDDLRKLAPTEQRIYRMRCVETWSMVIPWDGFSLGKLLDRVEPLSGAKYVAFETLLDKARFPGQARPGAVKWPYVEGLRMDEAMHPLAMLATGLYGQELPAQDGAPVRLAVPWKYGFKSIKSIVKITLLADQPPTAWNVSNPPAYGFYANVNPQVARPWPQDTERRIGGATHVPTMMFNGYGEQVASLYRGMDLSRDY